MRTNSDEASQSSANRGEPHRLTSAYVHFPWCARKCPYCDFATRGLPASKIPHEDYAQAVLREIGWRAPQLEGRRLHTVFFGGGTPSMWAPAELGRVLRGIEDTFGNAPSEVTVECNPQSFDAAYARALRDVGVGRVSIGLQSLDDERLRFLGRLHDRAGALRALRAALEVFERVNVDFMFGMPDQQTGSLQDELDEALQLGMRHVSAYALTIEPGTRFGALFDEGQLRVATEDDYADMFAGAEATFAARGLAHYEVSAYAAPGHEAQHNLHYWRGGAYLGLGAAAVGCLDERPGRSVRYRNESDARRYMAARDLDAVPTERETLDGDALMREALMLGLRTAEGVDVRAAEERCGVGLRDGRARALERALQSGDLIQTGGDAPRLKVPRDRWIRLDGIIGRVF